MATYLLDSHPLLKLFQKEKGYERVFSLLAKAERHGDRLCLQVINLGEILYSVKKKFGDKAKTQTLAHVFDMGLEIISVDDALVFEAAELKGTYPLSYGDSFALATALRLKATLVTGDPEFKSVQKLIPIYWIE